MIPHIYTSIFPMYAGIEVVNPSKPWTHPNPMHLTRRLYFTKKVERAYFTTEVGDTYGCKWFTVITWIKGTEVQQLIAVS